MGAAAVGLALNWLVESRTGQGLLTPFLGAPGPGGHNNADIIDVAYGTLAAGLSGYAVTTESKFEVNPDDTQQELEDEQQ